jgi:hypothetical protein
LSQDFIFRLVSAQILFNQKFEYYDNKSEYHKNEK